MRFKVTCAWPLFLSSLRQRWQRLLSVLLPLVLLTGVLTGCSIPRVSAEQRLFLNLSLELIGEYRIPADNFQGTKIGGLSALTYDRQQDQFYVLSDDRSSHGAARFYTVKVAVGAPAPEQPATRQGWLKSVQVEGVTFLKQEDGKPYAEGAIDPEGIALTPRGTVLITSEGVTRTGISPFIREFNRETGQLLQNLPLPKRYFARQTETGLSGVRDNLGLEALTVNPGSYNKQLLEPFRVFTATESALAQDETPTDPETGAKARFLHYLLGDGPPVLVSEHLYRLDPLPAGADRTGLTELLALDQGGHFLSLERSYGPATGFGAKIYQLATGGATDISEISSLAGQASGIRPIQKQLLLDLNTLNIRLDNLEGFTLGPRLPDGSESLFVISDNNFSQTQVTQLLLFRLKRGQ